MGVATRAWGRTVTTELCARLTAGAKRSGLGRRCLSRCGNGGWISASPPTCWWGDAHKWFSAVRLVSQVPAGRWFGTKVRDVDLSGFGRFILRDGDLGRVCWSADFEISNSGLSRLFPRIAEWRSAGPDLARYGTLVYYMATMRQEEFVCCSKGAPLRVLRAVLPQSPSPADQADRTNAEKDKGGRFRHSRPDAHALVVV
jgi:hypothetical protein